MWTRNSGKWEKYKFEQTQRKYKDDYIEQILMYQKCVNATVYTHANNLDVDIYDIYDNFSLDNWEEYQNTIKSHYTPNNIINDLVNIIQVDLASTLNIDILQTFINPILDSKIVLEGHQILLKDQTNTNENGIYKFTNGKFEQITSLSNYADRINFTVYVKLGIINKNKQFILERDLLSLYPSDTDNKTFKDGHNYVIKHKFEYKNLNDITLHEGDIKKANVINITGYDVRHNKSGTTEIVIENVPTGTLPNVSGNNVYLKINGHTDVIFNQQYTLITNEVLIPNGPNFDHVYTTDILGIGAVSTSENVSINFESNISITVGEFGLLFRDYLDITTGRKTDVIKTGDKNRLRGVFMTSDSFDNFTDIVYVCGNNGTILKSTDGGFIYNKLITNTTINLHDIHFYNTLSGIAVGERGLVLITEDGGLNWTKLQSTDINEQKTLNSVHMNDIGQGIVVGNRGIFFAVTKVGNVWSLSKIPLVRQENNLISYSIINDLNDIIYDNINNYFYIAGSDGLIIRIDTNFNLVFFEDVNQKFNFKCLTFSPNFILIAGNSNAILSMNPIISLNTNSNVSNISYITSSPTYNYEADHNYNRILYPIAGSNNIEQTIGIGNHTFYKKLGTGIWEDINSSIFEDIKTKLLVLDYKLGRKMYFIDNNGNVVKPTKLHKPSIPNTVYPGIDISTLTDNDIITFSSHTNEHNFWEYYIEHNLYDLVTLTKPNDYTIKTVIAPYRYSADNIVSGGATDFIVNDDHILLKLTNTALTLNQGDLIKVKIKETVPSFDTILEGTFMVISWDGTNAKVNEIFSETISNDFYNSVNPFTMEVENLNYIEEGNTLSYEYCLTEGFFNFYNFNYDTVNSVLSISAGDEYLSTYFNMRMKIDVNSTDIYLLDYEDSDINFKFGPYYNILNVLSDLDPVFTPTKTFSMPQLSFSYESSSISINQFVFDGNKIVMGSNHQSDWDQYHENTFVDIVHNSTDIITRLLILKKEIKVVDGITRYYIYFDYLIQNLISLHSVVTSDTVIIKSRNTLEEISYDLTRGDDVHHDIFLSNTTDNLNMRRYKENIASFNTDNYSKILIQDSDVKEHVTGLIYTDSKHDLAFNILNISDDPSFSFEPVELYDMGVEELPKRSNKIEPDNVETFINPNTKIGKKITGIDFSKYAFRLVDGLNIVTLAQKYGWILETEMEDAVIGEDSNGLVWYKGNWHCGIWSNGTWYSGNFYDGIWIDGIWNSRLVKDLGSTVIVKQIIKESYSSWLNGTFLNGTWNNGTHYDGTWNNGTWNDGLWLNGQWNDGFWNDGFWKGGFWITGQWEDGEFSMENATSIWLFGYWNGGDFKNGIWKGGFFNQKNNKLSRFGTGSTYQLRSIWENGSFINGEIHTFANVVNGDKKLPLLSTGYEYTVFNAGDIRLCRCYGATFKQGNWYGGNMLQGYIDGKIPINVNNFSITGNTLTLDVQNYKHYIKAGDKIQLIGDVDLTFLPSPIKSTHDEIGYNTKPGTHTVHSVDFNNGNIDIILQSPVLSDIDGTFGGYLDLSIAFTVHKGIWENSLWNGGLWLGGTWSGGMWVDGVWDDGKWMDVSNPQP